MTGYRLHFQDFRGYSKTRGDKIPPTQFRDYSTADEANAEKRRLSEAYGPDFVVCVTSITEPKAKRSAA